APGQLGADVGGQAEVLVVDVPAGGAEDADVHGTPAYCGSATCARAASLSSWRRRDRLCSDSVMIRTASSTSSVIWIRSRSWSEILPVPASWLLIQSTSPPQNSEPMRITGKLVTLRVCTRVSASNSSSSVPNPPGRAMNPHEYFTNMVLRTKK